MTLHPRLSSTGIALVKRFEGLRRKAGRLDDGRWTIGYGHTVSARQGAQVTEAEAEALLIYDLDKVARGLDGLVPAGLNDNQFAALTALAFNIGLDNFKTSAVLEHLKAGAPLQAAVALELWRRAEVQGDTLVVDGLVRRRAAEKALFLTPPGGFRPVPTPVVRAAYDAAGSDLSDAFEVSAPLEGETAVATPLGGPGAAAAAAAASVTAWLKELIPDAPAAAVSAEVVKNRPAVSAPAAEPVPPPAPEPAPALEPLFAVEPPPLVEPPPFVEPPPAAPRRNRFGGYDFLDGLDERSERRSQARAAGAAPIFAPPAPPPPAPSLRAPVVLLVGASGVVMFVAALVAMVYGKATLGNLAIGLLGVVCMAPAGVSLLLKLFDDHGTDPQA